MWLPVIFAQLSLRALHNYAFSPFIEHLGHTREKAITVERFVEANADETRREIGRISKQSPRNSPSLVVKRRMQIPSSRRLVLHGSVGGLGGIRFLSRSLTRIGIWPHHLDGNSEAQALRFQNVVKRDQSATISLRRIGTFVQFLFGRIRSSAGRFIDCSENFFGRRTDEDHRATLF